MKNIEEIRKAINEIDDQLIYLFEQRMDLAVDVAAYKSENDLPILDAKREEQVLDGIAKRISNPIYRDWAIDLFKHLMDYSKEYQNQLTANKQDKCSIGKVLYQGLAGSYGEEAACLYFGADAYLQNVARFEDVANEIHRGEARYGVLPLENSSTGSILDVYDILREYDCYIVGEVILKINHCLLGCQGGTIETIKQVYSHTQGFEQCSGFLKEHPQWECVPYHNTAISAELVSRSKDITKAAIASERAGKIHKLETLAKNINNNYNNYTRFIVISSAPIMDPNSDKISVMVQIDHKQGELYRVLSNLSENGLNMLKIESRPIQGMNWEYSFYIDVEGSLADVKTARAVKRLEEDSNYFKLLGNYKAAEI